jgi:hypothetical protein
MNNGYRFTFIIILLLALSSGLVYAQDKTVELYMLDGQLFNRPVRVYVSGLVDSLLINPRLYLVSMSKDKSALSAKNGLLNDKGISPGIIARDQKYEREINAPKTGTLLVFTLDDFHIPWYQPGISVLPVLYYGKEQVIVADREVYIAHRLGAIFFTTMIIALLIIVLNFLSKKDEGYLLGLLSTSDGRMSVSLTQVFLWTVAVGASVLIFAVTRLQVPNIPDSLWILMGLSVTTGVVSHFQTDSLQEEKRKRRKTSDEKKPITKPKLKHLIMVRLPSGEDDADLSKAQLLFWTLVTLTIFLIKSYIAGYLWDVPPALLVLMGISQTGYVSRKQLLVHQEKQETDKQGKQRKPENKVSDR